MMLRSCVSDETAKKVVEKMYKLYRNPKYKGLSIKDAVRATFNKVVI